jgi:FKBP-type peptidyl-prolyl cis-trans isomerase FkpA
MKQGMTVLGGVVAIMAIIIGVMFFGSAKKMNDNNTGPSKTPSAASAAAQSTTASGLKITDTTVGTGTEVMAGNTVTVKYTGTLADGTVFDSTEKQGGNPVSFPLTSVIKGWQEGIPGMKVGGKRTLVIPPDLAYGNQAVGGIPAGSTLTFEIELIAVKS